MNEYIVKIIKNGKVEETFTKKALTMIELHQTLREKYPLPVKIDLTPVDYGQS